MTTPLDFPASPTVGQKFTAQNNVVYIFDGVAWTIGYYDSNTQELQVVGDIIDQVRTLLQDTDASSGQYRYSTDSIVTNLNQSMGDLYRLRPDLFLEMGFQIPSFSVNSLTDPIGIEQQYLSPLIFYVVGLTQARDDEQTQDARADAFLQTFTKQILTAALT